MSSEDEYDDTETGPLRYPFREPRKDTWTWNEKCKSCDIRILSEDKRNVLFHPTWSEGSSTIIGTKLLNNTRSYWEIFLPRGVFGTSTMFGIGTKKTRLGTVGFTDIIGEDKNSWGLSHKGRLHHDGKSKKFCRPFRERFPVTVGVLFDGVYGTLTFYKNGVSLGIAFRDLQKVKEPLYPVISSSAARTVMILQETESEFVNLEDRCKAVLMDSIKDPITEIHTLPLPLTIQEMLVDECKVDESNEEDFDWYVSPI